MSGEFLQTVKKHLHSLLETHEGNSFSSIKSNWVIKEASNIDALQEGGTFRWVLQPFVCLPIPIFRNSIANSNPFGRHDRHTLWKRVQAVVVPLLAQLVSVIDRDQNLDILLDGNCAESVKRLWLDIFGDDKLLEIPRVTLDHK